MKFVIFLLIFCAFIQAPVRLLHAGEIPVSKLKYTGLDDAKLQEEAANLGIPEGLRARYVFEMKQLNQQYEAGSLTWTEYITQKRLLIENIE